MLFTNYGWTLVTVTSHTSHQMVTCFNKRIHQVTSRELRSVINNSRLTFKSHFPRNMSPPPLPHSFILLWNCKWASETGSETGSVPINQKSHPLYLLRQLLASSHERERLHVRQLAWGVVIVFPNNQNKNNKQQHQNKPFDIILQISFMLCGRRSGKSRWILSSYNIAQATLICSSRLNDYSIKS